MGNELGDERPKLQDRNSAEGLNEVPAVVQYLRASNVKEVPDTDVLAKVDVTTALDRRGLPSDSNMVWFIAT